MTVLTSIHNKFFEQRNIKKYQSFLSENFQFLEGILSIYLNRRVFVMSCPFILSVYPMILAAIAKMPIKVFFFSSLKMRYCYHYPFAARPSASIGPSTPSPLKPLGNISSNFMWSLLSKGIVILYKWSRSAW